MFSISLRREDHLRRYSIATFSSGWEVRLEEDAQIQRLVRYDDWHRVERALREFQREVVDLTARGWQEVPSA